MNEEYLLEMFETKVYILNMYAYVLNSILIYKEIFSNHTGLRLQNLQLIVVKYKKKRSFPFAMAITTIGKNIYIRIRV